MVRVPWSFSSVAVGVGDEKTWVVASVGVGVDEVGKASFSDGAHPVAKYKKSKNARTQGFTCLRDMPIQNIILFSTRLNSVTMMVWRAILYQEC